MTEQRTPLKGLDGDVLILRDALGVPHVKAQTVHDAFFGQGFVHAQDRLFQMEFDHRRSAGRWAECRGARALSYDIFNRRLGLESTSRADYDSFDGETRGVLDAYAAGVNAFIDGMTEPPMEFELLGLEPEHWRPWHCGSVLKVRHVLMGTFDYKLWRLRLAQALGPEAAVVVGTPHGREDPLIVPVGGSSRWTGSVTDFEPGALAVSPSPDGSNNWAIHGSRTASGRPLVAGDPHRTLEVPNVYYQNHIACPDFDAIGLSVPGVPGMFHFGHNAHVAWCVTHAMADTQDLYVERFDADGRYEFRGEWRQPQRRREIVAVQGDKPMRIDVITTHHGPIVFGDPEDGTAIAMRWTATDVPNTSLRTILPTLKASSAAELDDVMKEWVDPCNNLVIADVHGSIAYVHRGRIPIRSDANLMTPVPGWTGEHEWDGDVPYAELPRLRDPEAGYIVTANNRVCDGEYPHRLGVDYGPPYRARRVLERVNSLDHAKAEDMTSIHADQVSLAAKPFTDELAKLADLTDRAAEAQAILTEWNGQMDTDAIAPSIYAALREKIAEIILETEPFSALVENPYDDEPFPTAAIVRIRRALPRFFGSDTPAIDWPDALRRALDRAVEWLTELAGDDVSQWRWGRFHHTRQIHPLAALFPESADSLNPRAVPCGGDGDTVRATGTELGLHAYHASVARYVFDLADWDRSAWVIPLGSSGDPRSVHFADQADAWSRVELYPMTYSWPRLETEAESRQTLEASK